MHHGQLEIIDLDIQRLGYTKFISSWLYKGSEGNFLVDPGPACSIPILLKSLDEKEVRDLDWVLLTHVHQDHAGGLGDLIKKFPKAKVVCHEKGAPHLINPQGLWEGSKKILGDVAEVYGRILPIPDKAVHVLDEIPFGSGIKVIPTPGHASHHQCYIFKDWFFAGELFGAHIPISNGLYLRPATPHRFILEEYLKSMDLAGKHLKNNICFAHYGMANNPNHIFNSAKEQLQLWVNIVDKNKENNDMGTIINALLENDKIFSKYKELNTDMQNREWNFAINSIIGILKYLKKK